MPSLMNDLTVVHLLPAITGSIREGECPLHNFQNKFSIPPFPLDTITCLKLISFAIPRRTKSKFYF